MVDPVAVAVSASAAAVIGAFLPAGLARIPDPVVSEPAPGPEPGPEPAPEPGQEALTDVEAAHSGALVRGTPQVAVAALPTFAELASRPHLPLRIAVASALMGGIVGAYAGWTWPLAWLTVLAAVGVMLSYVDWRTYLLPTWMIYPTYVVVLVLMLLAALVSGAGEDLRRAGIAAAVALVLYWLPWRINSRWMGFGDVRLSALLGAVLGWAGWAETALGLYLPFLLGGLVAGALMVLRFLPRGAHPLGPFMFAGTLLGLLLGPIVLPGLG